MVTPNIQTPPWHGISITSIACIIYSIGNKTPNDPVNLFGVDYDAIDGTIVSSVHSQSHRELDHAHFIAMTNNSYNQI